VVAGRWTRVAIVDGSARVVPLMTISESACAISDPAARRSGVTLRCV